MPIVQSTPDEIRYADRLVRAKELAIRRLTASGKKVHIIWDLDHALFNGRSDDTFALLGFNVAKYFTYEERLIAEPLEHGIWWRLAMRCGDEGYHTTQDVVTARSSFLLLRVMHALVLERIPLRWQLFLGHQTKADSYRIILESFAKEPDTHIFCFDDAKKHVDAFIAVAEKLGMTDRCHGVVAPQVRDYDEAELRRGIDGVLNRTETEPYIVTVREGGAGKYWRQFHVVPDPHKALANMFWRAQDEARVTATVNANREMLEKWADEVWPGEKQNDRTLHMMLEMLREPG